jgi:uncharacterized DUF497 family protein
VQFEWDRNKNECNLRKHGVDFEETMSVFDDIFAVIIEDRFHSNSEQREIIVGRSLKGRFLYVVFVESENSIRIISARKLTPAERRRYEQRKSE